MKVSETEMVSIEIPQKELQELVMQYILRKHADLNSKNWKLEEFYIDWKPTGNETNMDAVYVMFIRCNPVEGFYRDSKCAGSCSRCVDPFSCK